jgi:hypothetical protein
LLPGKLPGNRHGPVVVQNMNGEPACPWFNPASTDDAGCPLEENLFGTVKLPGKRRPKIPENHTRLDRRWCEDDTPGIGDGTIDRRQIGEAQFTPDCCRQLPNGERGLEGIS